MNNDRRLIQCRVCHTELEQEYVYHVGDVVLCSSCMIDFAEEIRKEIDTYTSWVKDKGNPRDDN